MHPLCDIETMSAKLSHCPNVPVFELRALHSQKPVGSPSALDRKRKTSETASPKPQTLNPKTPKP